MVPDKLGNAVLPFVLFFLATEHACIVHIDLLT